VGTGHGGDGGRADTWCRRGRFSLPSRHTATAVLAAGACLHGAGARGGPARAAPLLAATAESASPVCLGVHWPADVIAGWFFAEGWQRLTRPR